VNVFGAVKPVANWLEPAALVEIGAW